MSKKLDELIPGCKFFTWEEALFLPQLNKHYEPTPTEEKNIIALAQALDKIRAKYGKPMKVTNWIRPEIDGVDYNALVGGAKASKHKVGLAVDIQDTNESIAQFNLLNIDFLTSLGIYVEDTEKTKGWEHYQLSKPRSGKNPFKI